MDLELIKKKTDLLVRRFGTNCPFKIAKGLGIYIQYEYLGKILGYYSKHYRIPIIHINESVGERQQLFICAHELGHAVLHPNENTPFLKKYTFFSTDCIEFEANVFAVELLFLRNNSDEVTSFHEAIEEYKIPKSFLNRLNS